LGSTLRISIQDGRIFLGTLVCTDKARNLILANAEEYRLEPVRKREQSLTRDQRSGGKSDKASGDMEEFEQKGRYVGMVMIPWKYILDVEEEQRSSISQISQWLI
jgi:small nuclear ribonucleoprotein (snRNP)-like protein